MKLGKKPARHNSVKLRLRTYLNLSQLPAPPSEFGHERLVSNWGILGNDRYGDCVWAGAAHETMMWNEESGKQVVFSDQSVLSDYSAVTGFDPNDPSTDGGTDMQEAASYRKKVGLLDSAGNRHKVGAYLAISRGNLDEHAIAAYLFGAVGLGVLVPSSAMDQFGNGQPWSVVAGSQLEGGHYVPLVNRRGAMFSVVTWGQLQPMTDDWFARYNDESIVYLSEEMLTNGKSLEGFDLQQLQDDLKALEAVK